MSAHTWLRLTKTDGTVIAYLAPNARVDDNYKNALYARARARGKAPKLEDNQVIMIELVIQGFFSHSDNVDADHRAALQTLFGSLPVTPEQQVNRIKHFMFQGGPFYLYHGTDEYRATTDAAVDWDANPAILPAVAVDEFVVSSRGGQAKERDFVLKLKVGI